MTTIGALIGTVAVMSWLTSDSPAAALAMGIKIFSGMTGMGAGIAGFSQGLCWEISQLSSVPLQD